MSSSICESANDHFPQNEYWNQNRFPLPSFDFKHNFHTNEDPFQLTALELSSFPDSIDELVERGFVDTPSPRRWTCDSIIENPPEFLRGQGPSPIQDSHAETHELTATADWSRVHPLSKTHDGTLLPTADVGRSMAVRVDEDMDIKRTANHSSNRVLPCAAETSNGESLGNGGLSQQQRLPVEQQNHASVLQCPFCDQQFKRRDYIKPHVKRKHSHCFDAFYSTSPPTSISSSGSPEDFPSAQDGFSVAGVSKFQERPRLVPFRALELDTQTSNSNQADVLFSGNSPKAEKRSLHDAFQHDHGILDCSDMRSSPRLKIFDFGPEKSFACPYSKNDPFQHLKCFGRSLQRPKDVKQHIYRCHMKPDYYCASCYKIFPNATERDVHSRSRLCERLDGPFLPQFQGITEKQRKLLSEKSSRDWDVEDQWFQIYAIVFPGFEKPRSPYVGNCWEDVVLLVRARWRAQGHMIMEHTAGDVSHDKLSSTLDLFLKSLEGETLEQRRTTAQPAS